MTDRRPDIHCTGCGVYCYSLSHRPEEQVFPESHYCEKCKEAIRRGVRTEDMLNHAWLQMFEDIKKQFRIMSKRKDSDDPVIDELGCLNVILEKRPFEDDCNKMTVEEWKEISMKKFNFFKKHYNKRQISLLKTFIESAHEMTNTEKKKILSEERKAREKESSETRRFFRNMWKNIMK